MVGSTVLVMGLSFALFAAIMTQLALHRKTASNLTAWSAAITGFFGLLLYGYGYTSIGLPAPLAVIRTTMSVFGMFLGKNELDNVESAPLFQSDWGQILFWVIHLFAFYATAGAAISALGTGLLERLRLMLARRGDLLLIYGVNANTVSFAKQLQERKDTSIVFIDPSPEPSQIKPIQNMGCLLRTDASAGSAAEEFLKKVGVRPGDRQIWLYCLERTHSQNLYYASAFLESARKMELQKEQLHLTLLSEDEAVYSNLLATQDSFGYRDVNILNEPQMVARLLIQENPPCDVLTFDETGAAQQDLDCLLVGYGRVGQCVLDQLLCHGQFAGSTFHATVFALDYNEVQGRLSSETRLLLDSYDLQFKAYDARSHEMYRYLHQHRNTLNYIAIAAGCEKKNQELAREIVHYLNHLNRSLPVYLCSYSGVTKLEAGKLPKTTGLYRKDILWSNTLDNRAMVLNQSYCSGNGKTKEENWSDCDYFSRLSSRASADFAPAFLRMAHLTKEEVAAGKWNPTGQLLENLAITEHDRWCAFHHTMGFTPMSLEEHAQRCRDKKAEIETKGKSKMKTTKDMRQHTHACLIPWDALDGLTEQERRILGNDVDYKQMDRNNILALPDVLVAE